MDHNHDADANNVALASNRRRRFVNSRFSRAAVADELRVRFLREIAISAPEVLAKLRDDVLPEYIQAYTAAMPPGADNSNSLVSFRWPPPLEIKITSWAKAVRLRRR